MEGLLSGFLCVSEFGRIEFWEGGHSFLNLTIAWRTGEVVSFGVCELGLRRDAMPRKDLAGCTEGFLGMLGMVGLP